MNLLWGGYENMFPGAEAKAMKGETQANTFDSTDLAPERSDPQAWNDSVLERVQYETPYLVPIGISSTRLAAAVRCTPSCGQCVAHYWA